VLGSYARETLSFIHLSDVWRCTQEIWVKINTLSQVIIKKYRNAFPHPKKRGNAFPLHYITAHSTGLLMDKKHLWSTAFLRFLFYCPFYHCSKSSNIAAIGLHLMSLLFEFLSLRPLCRWNSGLSTRRSSWLARFSSPSGLKTRKTILSTCSPRKETFQARCRSLICHQSSIHYESSCVAHAGASRGGVTLQW